MPNLTKLTVLLTDDELADARQWVGRFEGRPTGTRLGLRPFVIAIEGLAPPLQVGDTVVIRERDGGPIYDDAMRYQVIGFADDTMWRDRAPGNRAVIVQFKSDIPHIQPEGRLALVAATRTIGV
jgi:hypothetical protein